MLSADNYANSFGLDQNVGSDLDSKCLTLMEFLQDDFEKETAANKKPLPSHYVVGNFASDRHRHVRLGNENVFCFILSDPTYFLTDPKHLNVNKERKEK